MIESGAWTFARLGDASGFGEEKECPWGLGDGSGQVILSFRNDVENLTGTDAFVAFHR